MDGDLISVIIPVYNVERYLNQCIDSVVSQTYHNLEIILVDDGSSDNSGEICDKYAAKDNRIVVIHKTNGGLSDARNAGIKIAKGKYIGFVDSDDWIDSEMYDQLMTSISNSNSDIAICGLYREYLNKTAYNEILDCGSFSSQVALGKLIDNTDIHDHACTKLFKTELWNNIEFPVGKYYEDILTTYKLFAKAKKVSAIKNCLYHYRQRQGSIVRNGFNDTRFAYINAVESLLNDPLLKTNYKSLLEIRLLKVKYQLLWEFFLYSDQSSLKKYERQAIDWYKSIRANKWRICRLSGMSSSNKLMAVLSFLKFDIMYKLFRLKKVQLNNIKYYD